jgi:hypothetical protein
MVDSLDTLDFANIKGATYRAPTIFVRSLSSTPAGFVADIANFPQPAVLDVHLWRGRRAAVRP